MLICGFLLASTMTDDSVPRRLFRFLRIAIICQLVLVSTCRGFFQNLAASKRHYHPNFTTKSIGNAPSTVVVDDDVDQCPISSGAIQGVSSSTSATRTTTSTRLYESSSSSSSASSSPSPKQTKPPRFVQKAHTSQQKKKKATNKSMMGDSNFSGSNSGSSNSGSSNNNSNSNYRPRRGPPLPPGVVRSEKSIEDLENIMLKRWGTLDAATTTSTQTGPGGGRNKKKGSSSSSSSSSTTNPFQRAVLDPWANDNDGGNGQGTSYKKKNVVREFYDEDDEGFEIMELDDGDEDFIDDGEWEWEDGGPSATSPEARNPRMQISHLIQPQPAGGRGTNQPSVIDDSSSPPKPRKQQLQQQQQQQSYFFNPNKQPTPVAAADDEPNKASKRSEKSEPAADNNNNKASSSSKEQLAAASTRQPAKNRAPPAKALLDEDGNPLLMTTQEALIRFHSLTSEEDIAAMMTDDDADAPMVAYQQQQQQQDEEQPASWTKIGITSEILLENLNAMYCSAPLSVQEKSIPSILTGNDVLVGTYTGSGKTLAFLTPLIQRLLWNYGGGGDGGDNDDDFEDPGLAVLIVAPGRELASQIVSVARSLLENTPLRVQLAIGGTTFTRNLEQIRKKKPNIIVGTPGRIAELVVGKPGEKSGRLKIGDLQSVVLDEFDALLEYKPHREPTRAILQTLQRRHGDSLQSILCSATASDLIDSPKVTEYLRPGFATAMADDDDVFVTGASRSSSNKSRRTQVSRTVLHGVVHVPHRRFALDTVRRVLHTEPIPQQILIFVESARKVDVVVEKLAERGIIAAPLHGGQGSDKMDRAEVSKALREGYVGIVVATELAARGLDAPMLTHVINLDLPTDASHYAHRAGRCGRGGRPGVVINMTTSPKERNVPKRFAESLGIDMHAVEARDGKLIMVDPETQTVDE